MCKTLFSTFSNTKVQNLSIKSLFQMQIILKKIFISENDMLYKAITIKY